LADKRGGLITDTAETTSAPFVPVPLSAIQQSLPARFEEQVARFPDRLAVRAADGAFTYRELDSLANRIAHGVLARRGQEPEPVGLLLPQGARLVAAIMGVLKAGKLYVPLDPTHPPERGRQMLDDAGAELVITSSTSSTPSTPSMCFDQLIEGQPEDSPGLKLPPETLAYIYYTSGSTGRPKGVFDNHRNVLHNILRYTNSLKISASDRLTLLQPPGFSGAVSSTFSALLNGAAVFPYDVSREGLGRNLARWLRQEEITIYHSVPMIFRSFLHDGIRFPSIRVIRLEGDAASKVDIELFRAHFAPNCVLVNGLGATETGISRQFFVHRETPLPDGVVPIGYATPDISSAVIDEAGNEVPPGTTGQIAVRSRYLALGYWKQPELTRAAFHDGPPGSGERIYLTGDLGRMRADGCLEYLGRKHSGLKIRGSMVEPAEVECALLTLEAVREAAVVGRTDSHGNSQLVGYVVPSGSLPIPVPLLRKQLARVLPEFMIPARFVFLEALPMSPNGKVDRKALPAPDDHRDPRNLEYVPPEGELERRLAAIWEEVLDLSPVGRTDNFFDLGGDSVLAESVLLSLEEMTGREFPPATLMTAPTIARLADLVRSAPGDLPAVLVPIQTGGTAPPVFCLPEHGGRVWSAFATLSRHLGTDQPFYGLQSAGISGEQHPLTSIEAIARHHLAAIRAIQPQGPYFLAGRCFGGVVAMELAHQLTAAGEAVGLIFIFDATPEDFSELVPAEVLGRFQRGRLEQRVRSVATKLHPHRIWKGLPSLGQETLSTIWQNVRRRAIRWYLNRDSRLPPPLQEVRLVNQHAFSGHRSRTFPGRVTLLLRTEDRARYGPDPHQVWSRLATALDIRWLDGPVERFAAEQEVQTRQVAAHLQEALRAVTQEAARETG
jgi:amino acid adenylation domain-containing protein